MTGKKRARLPILISIAALIAVIVPAGLASGSHDGPPVIVGNTSVVLLNLGDTDNVTWTDQTQTITTARNKCTPVTFGTSPELLSVTPIGGDLGIVKDGLGIQSQGDGNSGPCGQAEAEDGEGIAIALGSTLSGYLIQAIDVDLELKFDAEVEITYYHNGQPVDSDTFDGMGPDDGPDSADLDNYRYNSEQEGINAFFDEVVFVALAGAFSLEAGVDGTENGALADNNSSQFEIVEAFDGEITCGQSADIGIPGVDTTYGTVTMHALDLDASSPGVGWEITEPPCIMKPYNSATALAALAFLPELENSEARYTLEVTVENQAITQDSNGTITSLLAEYNLTGDLSFPSGGTPVQRCQGQPIIDQLDVDYDAFWSQNSPVQVGEVDLLPTGEIICWYLASVTPTGIDVGTEVWGFLFIDDPSVRFK